MIFEIEFGPEKWCVTFYNKSEICNLVFDLVGTGEGNDNFVLMMMGCIRRLFYVRDEQQSFPTLTQDDYFDVFDDD